MKEKIFEKIKKLINMEVYELSAYNHIEFACDCYEHEFITMEELEELEKIYKEKFCIR